MNYNNQIIPVSAIIPTYNRTEVLGKTLQTIAIQNIQFTEIIIVDASENNLTEIMLLTNLNGLQSKIIYQKAIQKGAAAQRNQAVAISSLPFVCFMDDDVYLEPFCIERLWNCITSNGSIGAVNAMITNQRYHTPGIITKSMYWLMNGKKLTSYAGKMIGPAWNLLPQDDEQLPEQNKVDWLNLGCTIYRRIALPNPPFSAFFTGYSLMEDATLSVEVGKKWGLYNVRTARIFHDSQPGVHKNNLKELAKMELINRYYIMTNILGRTGIKNFVKLLIFQLFGIISSSNRFSRQVWLGKISAIKTIISKSSEK